MRMLLLPAMMMMRGVNRVVQNGASGDWRCSGNERGCDIRSREQEHEQASDQTHKSRLRPTHSLHQDRASAASQSSTVRRRSALPITVTELAAIAALAIIGFRRRPKAG
jgi:ferric-dicitrate binding protein FerR (iron transport regulator)